MLSSSSSLLIAGPHDGLDVSADVKISFDLHGQRIARCDEVFENDIDDVLVKDLHVAKRVDVELQTLEFNATFIGNVFETDYGEIGKIGERTDRRKLGNLEIDLYLASGKLIRKRIERKEFHLLTRSRLNVETLLVYRLHSLTVIASCTTTAMAPIEKLD